MKSEKLTSFALVIAAVALLIVGAMSYRDHLKAKYEKEFGVAAATPAAGSEPEQDSATGRISAVDALPPARTDDPPVPPDAGPVPPLPPATVDSSAPPVGATPPSAVDPKISQYQQSLETLRREGTLYSQKLKDTQNGASDGGLPPMPSLDVKPSVPPSAVAAATGSADALLPDGGIPSPPIPAPVSTEDVKKEVSAMAEKVRKEASIAKVIEYDHEWAFMVLDGGKDVGIEEEMRFAVRRGGEILGWVKITEVEQNRSVAHLMSANKNSKTTRKPARGDDIIAFNLF